MPDDGIQVNDDDAISIDDGDGIVVADDTADCCCTNTTLITCTQCIVAPDSLAVTLDVTACDKFGNGCSEIFEYPADEDGSCAHFSIYNPTGLSNTFNLGPADIDWPGSDALGNTETVNGETSTICSYRACYPKMVRGDWSQSFNGPDCQTGPCNLIYSITYDLMISASISLKQTGTDGDGPTYSIEIKVSAELRVSETCDGFGSAGLTVARGKIDIPVEIPESGFPTIDCTQAFELTPDYSGFGPCTEGIPVKEYAITVQGMNGEDAVIDRPASCVGCPEECSECCDTLTFTINGTECIGFTNGTESRIVYKRVSGPDSDTCQWERVNSEDEFIGDFITCDGSTWYLQVSTTCGPEGTPCLLTYTASAACVHCPPLTDEWTIDGDLSGCDTRFLYQGNGVLSCGESDI